MWKDEECGPILTGLYRQMQYKQAAFSKSVLVRV